MSIPYYVHIPPRACVPHETVVNTQTIDVQTAGVIFCCESKEIADALYKALNRVAWYRDYLD